MRLFFPVFIFTLLVLASPKLAYSAEKTYDQALSAATKEVSNIGYSPESMLMEYGDDDIIEGFKKKGTITYNAFYKKDWHPFHFCQGDGDSRTCVWVLISKTDDDAILW